MSVAPEDLEICLRVLQSLADFPSAIDDHKPLKTLIAKIHHRGSKEARRAARQRRAATDRQKIAGTGMVQRKLIQPPLEVDVPKVTLERQVCCYVCKQPFAELHFFYHQMCPTCAEVNWTKRQQSEDLSDRIALITGGRIKIGFQTTLKLLRDGAKVLVTTRFPEDAAIRYAREDDFEQWSERLDIHGLDLRDIPAVERFADHLVKSESQIDIIIHNAAQTIKRPLAFYSHLLEQRTLSPQQRSLIPSGAVSAAVLLEARPAYPDDLPGTEYYFPPASLDRDGQQVDLRPKNSWRSRLGEVDTIETLEVILVNAIAPFILSSRLRKLLQQSPFARRFIVNVSAMEGQFSRENRTPHHPHTNMAKAALNMLTRTSAEDLARDGIYMNSVDTGWITDEKPYRSAEQMRQSHGFYPPLDPIDGAARIYDPIARGINEPIRPLFGCFLKDYFPYP